MNRRLAAAAAVLGALGMAAAYAWAGPRRFWAEWIVWTLMLLSVGLGGLFIAALEHLTASRWSVPLRRTAERLGGLVVPASAAALAALAGLPAVYPWALPEAHGHGLAGAKAVWLSAPFFSLRAAACAAVWVLSWKALVWASVEQDRGLDPGLTARLRRRSAFFMATLALTVTLAAFDWVSSLDPAWYSDVIGVYLFSGVFLAGLAATVLAAGFLAGRGRLPGLRPDHLHGLGAWLFAFTVFWAYIAFAQYLLMWYANLPEEAAWYKARCEGPWLAATIVLGLAHFAVPFLALLTRRSKSDPARLRWVASLVLAAHFADLRWLVLPSLGLGPWISWPELAFALFFGGAALLWCGRELRRGADMPVGDPFLAEGLAFRL